MQWQQKQSTCNVHGLSVLERVLALRGIVTEKDRRSFLSPDFMRDVHDPFLFHAMHDAVARFVRARDNGEKVGIYGDYDADGVSGATLLHTALDDLGITNEVYIPHKERDGHGLSLRAVEHFARSGVALIVTVDCGITNIAEVATANERGIESIIIDHHHVPKVLPDAVAVINPKLPNSGYPFTELCGTGTAFKVVDALYATMTPAKREQTKWLLDLVAIATVADCMPLIGENRTLVAYGLIVLSKTRRVGLRAMFEVGRIAADRPTAHTIGFQIAPRINAAGRMGHAQDAYALLADPQAESARMKAEALEVMNNERRKVSERITKEAIQRIMAMPTMPAGIIIGDEDYFHGVVGLVAGRLAERFTRPVGVFQYMDTTALGSFRSRGGVHVVEVLNAVNKAVPGALIKYGGHAAAAGATIDRAYFDNFAQAFAQQVHEAFIALGSDNTDILVDAELLLSDVTLPLATEISRCAPFGIGNEEPLFAIRSVRVQSLRSVGTSGAHVKFTFVDARDGVQTVDGIGFSLAQKVVDIVSGDVVDLLAHVQVNTWQGRQTPQLMVVDIAKNS